MNRFYISSNSSSYRVNRVRFGLTAIECHGEIGGVGGWDLAEVNARSK